MIDYSKYDLKENGIPTDVVKEVQGQNAIKTICPKCSAERKTAVHRKEPVLYVNLDNGYCYCHNCGEQWRMDSRTHGAPLGEAPGMPPHGRVAHAGECDGHALPLAPHVADAS